MAFDKVVDSAVLESGLTSIANAIREKAGTSDALAFPAGFAEAIAAIESGVDLGELFGGKVATGSVILTEDTSSNVDIAFGGVFTDIPHFLFAFEENGYSGGTTERFYCQVIACQKINDSKGTANCLGTRFVINDGKKLGSSAIGWTNTVTKDKGVISFNYAGNGKAGVQYGWIAIGE